MSLRIQAYKFTGSLPGRMHYTSFYTPISQYRHIASRTELFNQMEGSILDNTDLQN